MPNKSLILKLAKTIAPSDAKIWIDDMANELSFIENNRFVWQIGALNFAIKERFTNINLKSPQNIAFGSFALTAVLAVIFVLPYKSTLFPQSPSQTSEPAPITASPQTAVAPARAEVSAELRVGINEITAQNDDEKTEKNTQIANTTVNNPVISAPSSEATLKSTNPNQGIDTENSTSSAGLANTVEEPVENIVNLADSLTDITTVSPSPEIASQAEEEVNTDVASNTDTLETSEQQSAIEETTVIAPTGPIGAVGMTGAIGASGPVGAVGMTGATGAVGARGAVGATGAMGATSAMGTIGAISTANKELKCWDTNANGYANTEEDINHDGRVDANDCTINATSPTENPAASSEISSEVYDKLNLEEQIVSEIEITTKNRILTNELIAENIRQVDVQYSDILISVKKASFIKIYSGIQADESNILVNRIINKNEELRLEAPLYLEIDNAANILINSENLSNDKKKLSFIIEAAQR